MVELDGSNALLRAGDQFKKVHTSSLVGTAESLDLPTVQDARAELDAVVLASLSNKQLDGVYREAKVFDELVLATAESPVNDRYEAAADVLGISVRTAYRRGQRYAEQGIVGLVDTRLLQPHRPAVSTEWDLACREALESYRDQSNPSMKSVLNKANALYLSRRPQGTVPSRAGAYRRLRELDKGRYTFGAAKQRRSVAERPGGVLGRLRADRPGQYVVLDTTPLDVFAMEPVTGRWINTELTVAMDLYSRCILGLILRPISTTAQDVAAVMFQVVTPQTWGPTGNEDVPAPYVGVPESLLAQETGALPDTIVVDHGKVYLSQRTRAVC
ncbi:hypothetical protein [Brachybacterium tyrofermentans]|uniref:hypothetical protein n=1 Tax=Brachybacterium tyrofermentans TaxID=47848 RepID=UPI003FD1759A